MSDFPKSLVHVYNGLVFLSVSSENATSFDLPRGTKFLREFTFCVLASFCVLGELIFTIRTLVLLAGNKFLQFSESPVQIIDNILVFFEYVQWKYRRAAVTLKENGKQFELAAVQGYRGRLDSHFHFVTLIFNGLL